MNFTVTRQNLNDENEQSWGPDDYFHPSSAVADAVKFFEKWGVDSVFIQKRGPGLFRWTASASVQRIYLLVKPWAKPEKVSLTSLGAETFKLAPGEFLLLNSDKSLQRQGS